MMRAIGPGRGLRRAAVLSLLVASVGAVPGAAQTPSQAERGERPVATDRYTVGEMVRRALRHHPSVAAASAAVDRAVSTMRREEAARLPAFALDASLTRFQEPMVVAPLHGFDVRQPPTFDRTLMQGGVSMSYTLFDGGARGARIERARALADAATDGVDAARQALMGEVVGAYLRVQSAREVVEANRQRVDAVERERDRAAQLFEQGRAARVLVLRADAALARARAEAHAARAELDVAERLLARLTGADPARIAEGSLARVHVARGDAASAVRVELVGRALERSPRIRRLRGRIAAAEAGRAEVRALWLPTIEAVGRYAGYGSALGVEQGEWQGGVRLSFPLFTGGERFAAGDRAAAELRAAEAELAVARLEIEAALDRALSALTAQRVRVEALEAAVEQSREVARIEKLALEAGTGVQADYLAAEADVLEARAALAEARAALIGARVELARITGELSPEWLEQNLESGS